MKRAFLKHFILVIAILALCSGCSQSNNLLGNSFSISSDNPQAVKYKNGAILVKEDEQNDITNQENIVNPNVGIKEIKFGPKDINFANKNS